MRGFYDRREKGSAATWSDPLNNAELAAAKKQGCAGCVWFAILPHEFCGLCHHAVRSGSENVSKDFWCSEWRGEPSEETP
jgi:hypothetical protein